MKRTPIHTWNDRDAFNDEATRLDLGTLQPEPETNPEEADALRRAFGTGPRRKLQPASQDDLYHPNPQKRLF
jgi:hypothetical protein